MKKANSKQKMTHMVYTLQRFKKEGLLCNSNPTKTENINPFLELGCCRNWSESEIQRQSIVWQRGIWDGQGCTEKWSTQWITFKIYVDRGWTRKENMAPVQRESNNLLPMSASWGIFRSARTSYTTSGGPARKILITYIQAHMPNKSSEDSSNQPDGPIGSPRRPPGQWPPPINPLGPLNRSLGLTELLRSP